MQKGAWLLAILGVIMVTLVGILIFVPAKNNWKEVPLSVPAGIAVSSPKANSEASSPLKITGVVNGNGWSGFEDQVGTVKLLDASGKELASGILTAITEWTTIPTNFETNLSFQSAIAQSGTLVFKNENPSGDPVRDKTFSLPVKIKKTGETMQVKVYFQSAQSGTDCNYVVVAERTIVKTSAPARAALEELLKGFTSEERQIFMTSINPGVEIQSLTIENGTAKVDFDETLEKNVGGSCRVTAIRSQITQTLKQFSTVKNVIISIDGRTEDILQP